MLNHSDPTASTGISVDASSIAIGALMQQTRKGVTKPLALSSKQLQFAKKELNPLAENVWPSTL